MAGASNEGWRQAADEIADAAQAQRRATKKAFDGRRTLRRLVNMVRKTFARVDRTIDRVNALSPPPQPIACGAGCPFCCHIRVTTSPPEVLALADHIERNWPVERVAALRRKLANLDTLTRGRDAAQRDKMRLPCPLLVDNDCSVHEMRPINCRGLASVDVMACRRAYGSHMDEPVPQVALQATAADGIGYGLVAGLGDAGDELISGHRAHDLAQRGDHCRVVTVRVPLEDVELIAGLRIALETHDAAGRWLGDEPLFEPSTWTGRAPETPKKKRSK